MDVRVQVDLSVAPAKKHLAEMHSAADSLTDDQTSVQVSFPPDKPKSMIAAFTIPKTREMDVIDRIMRRFALFMEDYQNQSAWFTKKEKDEKIRRRGGRNSRGGHASWDESVPCVRQSETEQSLRVDFRGIGKERPEEIVIRNRRPLSSSRKRE